MFQVHVSSVSSIFRFICKFHLDVSKVDQMLHAAVRLLLLVPCRGSRAKA
jgi:hypothetical protein